MEQRKDAWELAADAVRDAFSWASAQVAIVLDNVEAANAALHFNVSMDAQVLATINAIVFAMMIVIFSQPLSIRTGVVELKETNQVSTDPVHAPRVAYNDGVQIAGWFCLTSTLLMLWYRPIETCAFGCTAAADDRLMVFASGLTMFGGFAGTIVFIARFCVLSIRASEAQRDSGPPSSGFVPSAR